MSFSGYQCGWSKLFWVSPVFRPFIVLTNSCCKAASVKFIAGLWKKAHMTAYTTEGLPGHITVWAPHSSPYSTLSPPLTTVV